MANETEKKYGGMTAEPRQEEHYGKLVWVSPKVEEIRRTECLCYNCKNFKPKPDECLIAIETYALCQKFGIAFPIARCPEFVHGPAPLLES